jgi:hypothetical protein
VHNFQALLVADIRGMPLLAAALTLQRSLHHCCPRSQCRQIHVPIGVGPQQMTRFNADECKNAIVEAA